MFVYFAFTAMSHLLAYEMFSFSLICELRCLFVFSFQEKCQPPPKMSLQRLPQITSLKESNSHTKELETNVTMPFNGNQYGGKH